MVQQADSRTSAIASLASRLRLLQIDLVDHDEGARNSHLGDEIDRALAKVAPAERRAFLDELTAHFPTWDSEVGAGRRDSDRSEFDQRELDDSTFLVNRLIAVSSTLTPDQRQTIVRQLQTANLVANGAPQWPDSAARDLRKRLALAADEPIDPQRLLQAVSILAELVCSLDQLVWNSWRTIAPTTTVRRPESLRQRLGRFVSSGETVRAEIEHDVNKLRQLTASLVAALPQSWRIAVDRLRGILPEQVRSVAGGGAFGAEARYWRKYVELTRDMDPTAVEDEIRKGIAEYAEGLMHGAAKG